MQWLAEDDPDGFTYGNRRHQHRLAGSLLLKSCTHTCFFSLAVLLRLCVPMTLVTSTCNRRVSCLVRSNERDERESCHRNTPAWEPACIVPGIIPRFVRVLHTNGVLRTGAGHSIWVVAGREPWEGAHVPTLLRMSHPVEVHYHWPVHEEQLHGDATQGSEHGRAELSSNPRA